MIIEIVSNDQRYIEVDRLFRASGYDSKICKPSEVNKPDILILSVRNELSDEELRTVFGRVKASTRVFSGNGERVKKHFDGDICDYSKNEYFLSENAFLTAEATVSYLHSLTGGGAKGQKFFISGYGRIGKSLSKILSMLGGEVFVYARREAVQREIVNDGHYFVPIEFAPNADVIINTVPSVIFKGELIDKIPKEATIIELASVCGFEREERVNFALGLPGKILPKSAGKVIFDTVKNLL
jgi:dipicolinate synthase subunit A